MVGRFSSMFFLADRTYLQIIVSFLGEDFDDSEEITPNNPNIQVLRNGTLKIRRTSSDDVGHYFCRISNGIGIGLSRVVTVKVHGREIL